MRVSLRSRILAGRDAEMGGLNVQGPGPRIVLWSTRGLLVSFLGGLVVVVLFGLERKDGCGGTELVGVGWVFFGGGVKTGQ